MKAAVNRRAAQLAKLAIKLNSDDFNVFCDFAGHVSLITIKVYLGGWKAGADQDWARGIYLTNECSLECLEDAIAELQEIKNTGKVPTPPKADEPF